MFFWRKLYPYLQKSIPRNRNNKLLKILDKFATTYHSLYENLNYDCKNNGELFLLNKLNQSNNLNSIFDVGARYDTDYIDISQGRSINYHLFEINHKFFKLLRKIYQNLKKKKSF